MRFRVHCSRHGSDVLLDSSCVEDLRPAEGGFAIHWRCWCGERGVSAVRSAAARRNGEAAAVRTSAAR